MQRTRCGTPRDSDAIWRWEDLPRWWWGSPGSRGAPAGLHGDHLSADHGHQRAYSSSRPGAVVAPDADVLRANTVPGLVVGMAVASGIVLLGAVLTAVAVR